MLWGKLFRSQSKSYISKISHWSFFCDTWWGIASTSNQCLCWLRNQKVFIFVSFCWMIFPHYFNSHEKKLVMQQQLIDINEQYLPVWLRNITHTSRSVLSNLADMSVVMLGRKCSAHRVSNSAQSCDRWQRDNQLVSSIISTIEKSMM